MEEDTFMEDSMPAPSTSMDVDMENIEDENKLTQQFLKGEITFAEYSREWYGKDDEEEIEYRDEDTTSVPSKAPKVVIPRRSKLQLTSTLLGLMGEANIRFVRGEKEIAERMCYEIIRQKPSAPEPYQTLAQMYEESDPDKALQFSLLAAHLGPPDAHEWLRLAAIAKRKNDPKQEMLCYSQAVKAEPHNLSLHLKRLELLTALEDINFPTSALKISHLKCYHKIVTSMPPTESETIMKYMKLAAQLYHSGNEIERAMQVMSAAYKKCSSHFTLEDVNLFLEVLLACKEYQTCIEVFVTKVGIEIEAEIQTLCIDGKYEEHTHYVNCHIPHGMQVDLKTKLLVCFIHLKANIKFIEALLLDFLSNDVEQTGDLYMDVEEALSTVGQHELALKVLVPLTQSKSFNLGAVWLKHAECLKNLGRDDEAIVSYKKVLELAPQHTGAREMLFHIYEARNQMEEAISILNQDYRYPVSARLLYKQCCILKKFNKMTEYLKVGEDLLAKTFFKYRSRDELRFGRLTKRSPEMVYNYRITKGEKAVDDDAIQFDEDDPFKLSATEEWELFFELLNLAYYLSKYYVMQRLAYGALFSKNLTAQKQEVEFYCSQACVLNSDFTNAMPFIRELVIKHIKCPNANGIWNMLNQVGQLTQDIYYNKYVYRLFSKSVNPVKNLFLGNNLLVSARYLLALRYILKYHEQYGDSMTALVAAVALFSYAMQRTTKKNYNLTVLQGFSYLLKYQSLRKCDQESYYNLGRACQMLSLKNLAIEFYENALASAPAAQCPHHVVVDLTREIAFNLCQLYKEHSPHLARKYMMKYLVI